MSEKTGSAMRDIFINTLTICANFDEENGHKATVLLFQKRKIVADDILKNGETQEKINLLAYINSKLKEYYGII